MSILAVPDNITCAEDIVIPRELPYLLKDVAKAVLRAQPTVGLADFIARWFNRELAASSCEGGVVDVSALNAAISDCGKDETTMESFLTFCEARNVSASVIAAAKSLPVEAPTAPLALGLTLLSLTHRTIYEAVETLFSIGNDYSINSDLFLAALSGCGFYDPRLNSGIVTELKHAIAESSENGVISLCNMRDGRVGHLLQQLDAQTDY